MKIFMRGGGDGARTAFSSTGAGNNNKEVSCSCSKTQIRTQTQYKLANNMFLMEMY